MSTLAKEQTKWKRNQASKRSVADFLASLDALVTAKGFLLRNRDAVVDDNNASNEEIRDDIRFILSASPGSRPLLLTSSREPIAYTQNI